MKKIIFSLMAISLLIVACNDEKKTGEGENKEMTMSSSAENKQERNKTVVKASLESFMKGDLDGTFKDVTGDFVDYADGSTQPMRNMDTLKNFIKMLKESIENYKGDNLQYFVDGDYVLVTGEWGGTFQKDLMGIKATGKPVRFKDVDMFKLNEQGKITEHSSVQNIGAVLMTAGMMK